jgi:hypothetical protein
MNEIMNTDGFSESKTVSYRIGKGYRDGPYMSINLRTIQVKVLHHFGCIELTLERHFTHFDDISGSTKRITKYYSRLIGERLTLKYV